MISCGSCSSVWSGLSKAHCATCHITFAGVSGFDLHRKDGKCLTVAELAKRGVLETRLGVWGRAEAKSVSDFPWFSEKEGLSEAED